MHFDIGAGDGRYVAQRARQTPATAFIGIEPNHASLVEASRLAGREPAGRNSWFVLGSLDDLPGPFPGLASSVSILFPWGSLLRAVAIPEPAPLARLAGLCRPGARIDVVTAIDTATDGGELARIGLDGFSVQEMADGWTRAGFDDVALVALGQDHPYQTTWWRRIRQRASRQAWLLSARAR